MSRKGVAVKLNINDTVKVKLTQQGRELHRIAHIKFWSERGYMDANKPFPYRAPEEDVEGYSRWQLWDLMATFGPYIYMDCDPPFETEILLPPFADEPVIERARERGEAGNG